MTEDLLKQIEETRLNTTAYGYTFRGDTVEYYLYHPDALGLNCDKVNNDFLKLCEYKGKFSYLCYIENFGKEASEVRSQLNRTQKVSTELFRNINFFGTANYDKAQEKWYNVKNNQNPKNFNINFKQIFDKKGYNELLAEARKDYLGCESFYVEKAMVVRNTPVNCVVRVSNHEFKVKSLLDNDQHFGILLRIGNVTRDSYSDKGSLNSSSYKEFWVYNVSNDGSDDEKIRRFLQYVKNERFLRKEVCDNIFGIQDSNSNIFCSTKGNNEINDKQIISIPPPTYDKIDFDKATLIDGEDNIISYPHNQFPDKLLYFKVDWDKGTATLLKNNGTETKNTYKIEESKGSGRTFYITELQLKDYIKFILK